MRVDVGQKVGSGSSEQKTTTDKIPGNENNNPKVSKQGDFGLKELPGVGRFRIESTSSQGNLCGMFTHDISTVNLIGSPFMQNTYWDIFFNDPEMQQFNERDEYRNIDNFYDD